MNARGRARATFLAVVLSVLTTGIVLGTTSPAPAAVPVDEVHYTFTSDTSVAIDWRGDANDVRWGPTQAYGNNAVGKAPAWTPWSSPGPFWQLELTGLAAGATYHYSVGGGPDYSFHTSPTGAFRFDAIGDVGDTAHFSKLGATLDRIAGDNPSFVLMLGDLTYANASSSDQSAVDQHFNDVMRWSTSAAYMPVWGNHEYDVAGADDLRNYKGRLLMPHAAASPGSPAISCCGNDWGWFDAGAVRFVIYPEPWSGALADWQSKASVLMTQAQNDPTIKYIITAGHRPAYSTGYHPGESNLANILDGFGDRFSKYVLNLNGHSHDYERFQPIHGVTHVTAGAPSSLEAPWTSTDPRTAYRAMHLSHLRVDVDSNGLRLQAICDDSASAEDTTCTPGTVIDEYTIGVPPVTPPATDVYVDKNSSNCSDSASGTASTPFCTIAKGVSRLQPGSTLYIGNGSYAETIKPANNGTASNPIVITAWPGRNPVITGNGYGAYLSSRSYITISNLTFNGTVDDAIYLSKSDHITVSGNDVSHAGQPASGQTARGIYVKATTASTITGNTITQVTNAGVYVTTGSTGITVSYNESSRNAAGYQRAGIGIWVNSPGNTILGNVTHDNEDSGIQFTTGGDNNLATLNVSYNNGDHGIDDLNVTGGRLIGNTVYRNCTSGINVEGTSGNYVVKNNIAVDNAVYPAYGGISCNRRAGNIGIWDSAPGSTTVDHNLVWLSKPGTMYVFGSAYTSLAQMQAATGQESHGVQADPRFSAPASWNLDLNPGSPAIDRGDSAATGEQAQDLLGFARVDDPSTPNTYATGPRLYDDLGAYEFQPDSAPSSQPPVAALTLSPNTGNAPVETTADASASTDPQGQSLSYRFDFGDGTAVVGPQAGATATHTYTNPGTYTVTTTVTNTAGLSSTKHATMSVNTAPPGPPVAALTLTPSSGTAPLQTTADASGSTDPQGRALTYAFDFGDGTAQVGPQSSPTANHTYANPGTFTVSVTVTNSASLTSTTQSSITVTAAAVAPPVYINQVATNYSTATKTSSYVTVWRAGGVQAGDLVVITLQLSNTAPTGTVAGTDDKGNVYPMVSSVSDGAGNRLVVLAGRAVTALAVNDKISATFPSSAGYRMLADEYSGVSTVDKTAGATGTTTTFSSGPAGVTTAASELVYSAVSMPSGTANPTWVSPWKDLGSYAVGSRYLGRSHQLVTAPGTFNGSGTASGAWLAITATFK
ncbi:MAG: PKD domain-containing protein [Nocardioidaceae bacterium]